MIDGVRAFYRVYDQRTEDETRIWLQKFYVRKETPKGVWLVYNIDNIRPFRFMLIGTRKQFAHDTIENALTAFRKRKTRQLGILNAQISSIEHALFLAESKDNISNIKYYEGQGDYVR